MQEKRDLLCVKLYEHDKMQCPSTIDTLIAIESQLVPLTKEFSAANVLPLM